MSSAVPNNQTHEQELEIEEKFELPVLEFLEDEFSRDRPRRSLVPPRDVVDYFAQRRRKEFLPDPGSKVKLLSRGEVFADISEISGDSIVAVRAAFAKKKKERAHIDLQSARRSTRKRKPSARALDSVEDDCFEDFKVPSPPKKSKQRKGKRGPGRPKKVVTESSASSPSEPLVTVTPVHESSEGKPPSRADDPHKEESGQFCFCNRTYDDSMCLVNCNKCNQWFHVACLALDEDLVKRSPFFFCHRCIQNDDVPEDQKRLSPKLNSITVATR